MNLLNSKIVKRFTNFFVFLLAFFVQVNVKAWEVDMSRRKKELETLRLPASIVDQPALTEENVVTSFFESTGPTQDIVILNTEKGFVPETVHLKKGQSYRIHVVNVNGKEKNTSFVLDGFSEHHATFFGEEKKFQISPKADGTFAFQCPETSQQGKIIVFSDSVPSARKPASK